MPENSHLKMDIILPWLNLVSMIGTDYTESWGETGTYTYLFTYTYLLAAPGIDPQAFEESLQPMILAECPWLEEYKMKIDLRMQPIQDIHLASN